MRRVLVFVGLVASCSTRTPDTLPLQGTSTVAPRARRASTPAPVKLVRRSLYCVNLVADANGLYWTEDGPDHAGEVLFLPVPSNGRPPRPLWRAERNTFRALAVDATSLFAAVPTQGLMMSIDRGAKKGGPITSLVEGPGVERLAYRGALYAVVDHHLRRFDGATWIDLAKVPPISRFEVSDRHVVFSYLPEEGALPRLARVPTSGGAVEVVVDVVHGGWAMNGTSIIVGIDSSSLSIIGPDSRTPVSLGVDGDPLGVVDDKLLLRQYDPADLMYEQARVYSLTSHTLSAPVTLGRSSVIQEEEFSDGAFWYVQSSYENDEYFYDIMMFVP